MSLTDVALKSLGPRENSYKVFDGEGLYIEVLKTGTKVWRFKYRFGGKEKRLTLGRYPRLSLKQARLEHQAAQAVLEGGFDPAETKRRRRKEESGENTFRGAAQDWIAKQQPRWSEKYRQALEARLDRFVYPHIGEADLKEIKPRDILAFLRPIEAAGKLTTAYRVLNLCSMIFRYGVACDLCPSDPCRDLCGALASHVAKPRAALTDPGQVGRLMAQIESYPGSVSIRLAMKWAALTFCRPGEVRQAEWVEIDWEKRIWKIPAEKMKMRREHRVPLSSQCMEILETLRALHLSEKWLFPSPQRSKPISTVGILGALRLMGYEKEEMSAHGFRAMASTLLHELGWDSDVIEIQLSHADRNAVRAVYNRARYWSRRVEMMQAWADYLDRLKQAALPSVSSPV